VAWVTDRKDVLSGLFFMLTLGAYVRYARHRFSLVRYLAVVVFFALGLMAKPTLVTLPFVLLLLDYWPLGRMDVKPRSAIELNGAAAGRGIIGRGLGLFVEKIPLLALAVAACGLTLWAEREVVVTTAQLPSYWRIGNVLVSYVAYLRQFFCPTGLALWYPLVISNLQTWKIVSCFGLLTAVTVGALVARRKYPYVLVGWL
jgi:protein O-mannosyl-transferase